jgi:hypothetical protein
MLFQNSNIYWVFVTTVSAAVVSCTQDSKSSNDYTDELLEMPVASALLASRFESLPDLKNQVDIEYELFTKPTDSIQKGLVRLTYTSNGRTCVTELPTGITQNEIIKVRDGGIVDGLNLIMKSPYAIANRVDLNKIYKLARRRQALFGEGDVAFFDLAEHSYYNINTAELAFLTTLDSSEKGYINTFNHVTAQAIITTLFSKEIADFVADVHERKNMPELIFGNFDPEQLTNPNNNPVDNYVDLVNNELGQEIGLILKRKYQINNETVWTSKLLTEYLNDLQEYYMRSFGISMKPFRSIDELITRFAEKINGVKRGVPYGALY